MTNADQRLTEDVEKFSYAISELYSHTFKPLLDVVYHTHSLSKVMGYQSQFALYAYYVFAAYLLRSISPPLTQMTAQVRSVKQLFLDCSWIATCQQTGSLQFGNVTHRAKVADAAEFPTSAQLPFQYIESTQRHSTRLELHTVLIFLCIILQLLHTRG